MLKPEKQRQVAIIREDECIGCTKCIQACPVDAILGSAKHMHTVITDECISCKLCIPPCPVDCIEMVTSASEKPDAALVKHRYQIRKTRLQNKAARPTLQEQAMTDKQSYIESAIARAKQRKPSP